MPQGASVSGAIISNLIFEVSVQVYLFELAQLAS